MSPTLVVQPSDSATVFLLRKGWPSTVSSRRERWLGLLFKPSTQTHTQFHHHKLSLTSFVTFVYSSTTSAPVQFHTNYCIYLNGVHGLPKQAPIYSISFSSSLFFYTLSSLAATLYFPLLFLQFTPNTANNQQVHNCKPNSKNKSFLKQNQTISSFVSQLVDLFLSLSLSLSISRKPSQPGLYESQLKI